MGNDVNTYSMILELERKAAEHGDLAILASQKQNRSLESYHKELAHESWRKARRLRNKII